MNGKRATRYRAEVVDIFGEVVWEMLATDMPNAELTRVLKREGYTVRRSSVPKLNQLDSIMPMAYSPHDPENSIRAAYEHAGRRTTQHTRALLYLIEHEGQWVDRTMIRRIAGDSGDKRVRDLRQIGWPIEISQLEAGEAWHVRLKLPPGQGTLLTL